MRSLPDRAARSSALPGLPRVSELGRSVRKTRPWAMAGLLYPAPTGTRHRTGGPPAGNVSTMSLSRHTPSACGPCQCGQSSAHADEAPRKSRRAKRRRKGGMGWAGGGWIYRRRRKSDAESWISVRLFSAPSASSCKTGLDESGFRKVSDRSIAEHGRFYRRPQRTQRSNAGVGISASELRDLR